MNNKTINFNHLGFSIKLIDWPHLKIDGELIPDVDYQLLELLVFRQLPMKPSKLTGSEIKFLRHHLGKTQAEFSKWLNNDSSVPTISNWEKFDLLPTKMSADTEVMLRLNIMKYIFENLRRKNFSFDQISNFKKAVAKSNSCPLQLDSRRFFPLAKNPPFDGSAYHIVLHG